jgi:phospholipid transport system transporter-binding protein
VKIEVDRIDITNAASLLQSGDSAIQGGDDQIDLSGVHRCDSSAVALLLAWERTAKARGMRLQLRGVPADLHSLASLYGVDTLISVAG